MTRYGMQEAEMKRVARCMREVLIDRVPSDKVGSEVEELRAGFTTVGYCFNS
jgi:glycine/serine hydroxymethyltransferase